MDSYRKRTTSTVSAAPTANWSTYDVVPGPSREYQKGLGYRLKKEVRRKVPITKWLPKYNWRWLLPDFIAGFTVWMTAISAGMGDAAIAGVSPEYGLYSAYMGPFIYVVLGSCRELVIGPQAVISLLSYQACGNDNPECVMLLGFYSGIIHLIMGALHLGFLVSFIPEPVTAGFTTGAALLIGSGQATGFLGLTKKASGTNLITIWRKVIEQIGDARWQDGLLALFSIVVLVLLQKLEDIKALQRWKKPLHFVNLARNAIVMVASTLLGFFVYDSGIFNMTGQVRDGFPPVELLNFRLYDPDILVNGTVPEGAERMSYGDTLKFFGTIPAVLALIEILQNVAISKRFSDGTEPVDATQEMISLGFVNAIGSGFFCAIPSSASFSRSAVNASSGVKSHLSGLFSGLLMVMSLALFTPMFKYVPKASLSAIIIAALLHMVDFHTLVTIWRLSKLEFLISVATFLAAILLGMEFGIAVGVGLSLSLLLLKMLHPKIIAEHRIDRTTKLAYIFIDTNQGLNFPSVDHLRDEMAMLLKDKPEDGAASGGGYVSPPIVVLDCSRWGRWDFSAVSTVTAIADRIKKRGKVLIFYRMEEKWAALLRSHSDWNDANKELRICHDQFELAKAILDIQNKVTTRYRSISFVNQRLPKGDNVP